MKFVVQVAAFVYNITVLFLAKLMPVCGYVNGKNHFYWKNQSQVSGMVNSKPKDQLLS